MSKDNELAKKLLKNTQCFKGEEVAPYKVSTGSLQLDALTGGGFGAGIHRFVGDNEGGKTSEALVVMENFLKDKLPKKTKGIFFNIEYRLTLQKRAACSFKFVSESEIDKWVEGTCLVVDTNSYEGVAQWVESMSKEQEFLYCMVADSLDNLIPDGDKDKKFTEANKVAGGAVIASVLSKRIAIPTRKFGHMVILLSQVRGKIPKNSMTPMEQINATGGNALLHAADYILEFKMRRSQGNLIKGDMESGKADTDQSGQLDIVKRRKIGHKARVKVCKSENESTGYEVEYPIKYFGGKGRIWVENEVFDFMKSFAVVEGSQWMNLPDDPTDPIYSFKKKLPKSLEVGMKIQGHANWVQKLENEPELTQYFYDYLLSLLV